MLKDSLECNESPVIPSTCRFVRHPKFLHGFQFGRVGPIEPNGLSPQPM